MTDAGALTDLAEEAERLRAELAAINQEEALLIAETTADIAGIVDPTPISDATAAAIALKRGDLFAAGLSVASMIPWVGDALAKPLKGAKAAKALAKLASLKKRTEALLNATMARLRKSKGASASDNAAGAVGKGAKKPDQEPSCLKNCGQGNKRVTGKDLRGGEVLNPPYKPRKTKGTPEEDVSEPLDSPAGRRFDEIDRLTPSDIPSDAHEQFKIAQLKSFDGPPTRPTVTEGQKIYRVIGSDGNPSGAYWSTKPPPATEAEWRRGSAVKNDWNSDGGYVEVELTADQADFINKNGFTGKAAPQPNSDNSGYLAGGDEQIWLPIDKDGGPKVWKNENGEDIALNPPEVKPTGWPKPKADLLDGN